MNKYLKIGLFVCLVWWTQFAFAQNTIPVNTYYSFEATYTPGYTYSWWYIGNAGDTTYFSSHSNITEEYYWDTKGDYELFVQASDGNNCLSEIITKNFIVNYKSNNLGNFAGKDTTIVECQPIVLGGEITDEENYGFLWEPAENLDDPTSPTPTFIPGNTTIFKLTVTNSLGVSVVDSVEITVSEIIAEAGDDVLMYEKLFIYFKWHRQYWSRSSIQLDYNFRENR